MDLALFLLAFTMLWKSSQSVRCYKCIGEKLSYMSTPACTDFNYSEAFIVDCSSSTMCFKRLTTLDLGNGLVTKSEVRGCAPQTISGDQRKINGKWQQVHEVYEVYDEGCEEKTSDYQSATKTLDCYCRGDLCNSATSTKLTLVSFVNIVIWYLLR